VAKIRQGHREFGPDLMIDPKASRCAPFILKFPSKTPSKYRSSIPCLIVLAAAIIPFSVMLTALRINSISEGDFIILKRAKEP